MECVGVGVWDMDGDGSAIIEIIYCTYFLNLGATNWLNVGTCENSKEFSGYLVFKTRLTHQTNFVNIDYQF